MAAALFFHLPFVSTTQASERLEKGPRYTAWILQKKVPRQGEGKGRAGQDADGRIAGVWPAGGGWAVRAAAHRQGSDHLRLQCACGFILQDSSPVQL